MSRRTISIAFVSLALTSGCSNPTLQSDSLAAESLRIPSVTATPPSETETAEPVPVALAGSTTPEHAAGEAQLVRFVPPPATLAGDLVHVTEDLLTETLVVAEGQTLVVEHGTILRASDWMDVRGTIQTAPRDDSHDGASFSLRCDGAIYVGAKGSITAGNGTTGDPDRDGSTDGGVGGALGIDCPVLVVDGVVRAGSGGAGGLDGSGGAGGGVHMTIADLWCLTPTSERVGTQVNAGPGGAAGVTGSRRTEGAVARQGSRGGQNTYTLPDAATLDAWGLADPDPESILEYVVEAGFVWGVPGVGAGGGENSGARSPEMPAGFYPACGWHPTER